ncbi:M48 family peptidase [Campylobacter sputorum subsp. bubulus]|uniref:M48 family peptidase n=1 Tax=Campylobacter sputorum subsp. sputorum TaxID=32024 RepID=A0A381DJ73_9BACT|nr:M48 family metallopeptidase [Campylobacter sputorum]ASM35717.1 peptidase, M48 family [Campylobacter sputorum aubsp. sputorum RM3237]KAB0580687.1 M48 family metallopeptidase [Campylobacter sputorum subsp. sputorum]QEL05907.1 peptidase, M48 family [Campylobacter sputorum subsp. sputorum]SUX08997.1 M48 family peptidase [Campylobacter sputorum subsp. bubulus]SUX10685.1 M48 family peptidase [Campylobacter sputorum subsp. sputorum]
MKKLIIVLPFLILLFVGCSSSTSAGMVGSDRKQLFLISENEMNQGANQAYSKVLQDAKSKNVLNNNNLTTKRVRGIANNLISQVGVFRKDALNWDWQVNVINQPILNAWCMPGGKIVVYDGIITKLNLDDDELAAIIGHEMSHALREHSREQASRDRIKQLGIFAISQFSGIGGNLANVAAQYTFVLPFSRENEVEADRMGIELAARAGYDPNGAVRLWQKMVAASSSSQPEFLSTHPSPQSRIEDLKIIAKKIEPIYKANKR